VEERWLFSFSFLVFSLSFSLIVCVCVLCHWWLVWVCSLTVSLSDGGDVSSVWLVLLGDQ